MPELIPILKREEITNSISAIAQKISVEYEGRELVLVGVLKGAFIFLSDLARHITIPVAIDFVGTSSYGTEANSSGNIHLTKTLTIDVKNKDVIIVEDIIDTGLTLTYLIDYINSFDPRSVKVCTLIDKTERRKTEARIDYICHTIEKGFLVGYGLDYNEQYRGLADIYHLIL